MFRSPTPFGQSLDGAFGSASVFEEINNSSGNLFGSSSTTTFGSQTVGSIDGGPSSGVFGSKMTASGASSTPAFGSSSSSFGGSSTFGQQPAFGGFGSTASPFNTAFQQTQSAFGSSGFGSSTSFGASSQPTFVAASSPTLGSTSTPAFGATPTTAFGSTLKTAFGSSGATFGISSAAAFGLGGAYGASSTSVFSSSITPALRSSSTPTFGVSSTPAFGASTTQAFSFNPAFGQSTSTLGSRLFGNQTSSFGTQSIPLDCCSGVPTTASTFGSTISGHSAFGDQRGGSRIAAYTTTAEINGSSGTQPAGKLVSISAMSVYKVKSHEELRWHDYQFGDKGGPIRPVQSVGGNGFVASNSAGGNGFVASNPFTPKTSASSASGFGAFGTSSTAYPFGTISSSTTSTLGATSAPALRNSTSSSIFSAWSTPALSSPSSIFSPVSVLGTTPASGLSLGFANTLSSPSFQSVLSLGQTNAAFGQTSAPSFSQSSVSSTPSTRLAGNFFSSTLSPVSTSNQVGFDRTTTSFPKEYFQPAHPAQTVGVFPNSNSGQTSTASSSGGGISSVSSQGTFTQVSATPSTGVVQPLPFSNPFGALPPIPQKFVGRSESAPLIQYGISSMPVSDKPTPVRISTLLTSRHLSQGRIRLPVRKYYPKNEGQKVPFFSNDEGILGAPRADALFTPRENPRALIIHHTEQWPLRANAENMPPLKDAYTHVHRNENSAKSSIIQEQTGSAKINFKPNGVHDDHSTQKEDSYVTLTGCRTGKAAIKYEHGADVEVLMPKLRHPDYYTEPQIEELAAMERAEPGFCCRVKDFVVGRYGYGSIKFPGETDVRQLDLESLVQFNNREVIVYIDESKKPPVGQGLNKPAEVTLLNIKCFNRKTSEQYVDGPKVDKYREMLMKKANDQGAEFVSYDPVVGEWKFRVQHFSKYGFRDDDEDKVDLDIYAATM